MRYSVGSVTQLSHPRPDVFLSQGRAGKLSREHLKIELIKHRPNCVSAPHTRDPPRVRVCVCVFLYLHIKHQILHSTEGEDLVLSLRL